MSRVCSVCNKGQNSGNNVSHSNRKTRRTFKANVQKVKIVKDGFFNFNFGMAGASSLILAIIIFVCSASYYLFSKRRANDA